MEVKDRYRQFGEWKQQPHQVAPLSEDEHECATCGTHYEGNYCPRCGQSARIGRYSFKKALLLAVIPIKQLSGYSYRGTIWRLLLALIPFIFVIFLLYFAAAVYVITTEHPEFFQE